MGFRSRKRFPGARVDSQFATRRRTGRLPVAGRSVPASVANPLLSFFFVFFWLSRIKLGGFGRVAEGGKCFKTFRGGETAFPTAFVLVLPACSAVTSRPCRARCASCSECRIGRPTRRTYGNISTVVVSSRQLPRRPPAPRPHFSARKKATAAEKPCVEIVSFRLVFMRRAPGRTQRRRASPPTGTLLSSPGSYISRSHRRCGCDQPISVLPAFVAFQPRSTRFCT